MSNQKEMNEAEIKRLIGKYANQLHEQIEAIIDLFMTIFNQRRNANPCLKCAGDKRFIQSTRPDIMAAKVLFGIK